MQSFFDFDRNFFAKLTKLRSSFERKCFDGVISKKNSETYHIFLTSDKFFLSFARGSLSRHLFSQNWYLPVQRNNLGIKTFWTFSRKMFILNVSKLTLVDVSETFSADQLWFRILSGLFQRCSLPENLWTALIHLWTALKTQIFRAQNQRWNSAVSAVIFSETALNSADFWIIQNDKY